MIDRFEEERLALYRRSLKEKLEKYEMMIQLENSNIRCLSSKLELTKEQQEFLKNS